MKNGELLPTMGKLTSGGTAHEPPELSVIKLDRIGMPPNNPMNPSVVTVTGHRHRYANQAELRYGDHHLTCVT